MIQQHEIELRDITIFEQDHNRKTSYSTRIRGIAMRLESS